MESSLPLGTFLGVNFVFFGLVLGSYRLVGYLFYGSSLFMCVYVCVVPPSRCFPSSLLQLYLLSMCVLLDFFHL